jgi:hypothetical protein
MALIRRESVDIDAQLTKTTPNDLDPGVRERLSQLRRHPGGDRALGESDRALVDDDGTHVDAATVIGAVLEGGFRVLRADVNQLDLNFDGLGLRDGLLPSHNPRRCATSALAHLSDNDSAAGGGKRPEHLVK